MVLKELKRVALLCPHLRVCPVVLAGEVTVRVLVTEVPLGRRP